MSTIRLRDMCTFNNPRGRTYSVGWWWLVIPSQCNQIVVDTYEPCGSGWVLCIFWAYRRRKNNINIQLFQYLKIKYHAQLRTVHAFRIMNDETYNIAI